MAVEKGKVIAKLNEIFKGKSVTNTFKENLATKWAAKIETDEDIDAYVEDRKEDILEASTEADRRATQAADKARKDAAKAAAGDKPDDVKPEIPDDTPAYMKAFMQEFKEIKAEISGIKATKQAETVESKFRAHTAIKDIPESFYKRAIPSKEEDIETTATEIAKEWGEIQTQYKFSSFGNDKPGANRGAIVKEEGESKPDEAVANFAKAKNEKFIQEQSKN
jgi:hypothetical protein